MGNRSSDTESLRPVVSGFFESRQPRRSRKVALIVVDAGQGHRQAASILRETIEARGPHYEVTILSAVDDLAEHGPLRHVGSLLTAAFNGGLRNRWYGFNDALYRGMCALSTVIEPLGRMQVRRYLQRERPDIVVSVASVVNDMLAKPLQEFGIPFGLVMLDLADIPGRPWLGREAVQASTFVAVPSPRAAKQALASGATEKQLLRCSPLVNPRCRDLSLQVSKRGTIRRQLSLSPTAFTVLVMVGGIGAHRVAEIVSALGRIDTPMQIIACAGHDEALFQTLENMRSASKHTLVPLRFTQELHRYLRAADVVVTKPGAPSVMEAVASGAPVVLDAERVMRQERETLNYVRERDYGLVCASLEEITEAVSKVRSDPLLKQRLLKNVARALTEADAAGCIVDAIEASFPAEDTERERKVM